MGKKRSIVSEPISLRTAQEFFSGFEEKGYLDTFCNYTGGVFHAEKFKQWSELDDFKGVFFWYCWDGDKVSLAAELKRGVIYSNDMIHTYFPELENEVIESTNYLMSSGEKDWYPFRSVDEFKHDVLTPSLPDRITNGGQIKSKVSAFINIFVKEDLCIVPFAFIADDYGDVELEPFFTRFLSTPELKYISYHFGYSEIDKPQFLRLVLVGRDSEGYPIFTKDSIKSFDFLINNGSRPPKKPPTP